MIDPNILNGHCCTKEEWDKLVRKWSEEHILTWEDEEAIADQMERMGGGNLIGRPSQYENMDKTTGKNEHMRSSCSCSGSGHYS